MKKVALLVMSLVALGAFGFGSGAYAQGTSITIQMNQENGSGQNGTAILTDMGNNQTMVVVNISGGSGVAQPDHIHKGTCAALDPTPAYPLSNVVNGTSTTTVPVGLSTLLAGQFAVNVHKSATEASVYVSCGDIVANATTGTGTGTGSSTGTTTPGMPTTGSGTDLALLVALVLVALSSLGTGLVLARRKA